MTTLEGKSCCLVSWRKEFVDELQAQASSEGITRYMLDSFPQPYTIEEAHSWINRNLEAPNNARNLCICIKDAEGELHVAGGTGLETNSDINSRHVVTLGYWLGRQYWGRGIMTEVVGLMVDYAFSDTFKTIVNEGHPVVRVVGQVFDGNAASARVLEKNGFQLEGRHRFALMKEGKLFDCLTFAKLRDLELG